MYNSVWLLVVLVGVVVGSDVCCDFMKSGILCGETLTGTACGSLEPNKCNPMSREYYGAKYVMSFSNAFCFYSDKDCLSSTVCYNEYDFNSTSCVAGNWDNVPYGVRCYTPSSSSPASTLSHSFDI